MNVQRGSQHSGHMMPAATEKNIRALKITALLTGVYFIIELGIGITQVLLLYFQILSILFRRLVEFYLH